jgi:hypothetical protein
MADTVEKVAPWIFELGRKKIDLSDRPTNRSRTPVKGKKAPERPPDRDGQRLFQQYPQLAVSPKFHVTSKPEKFAGTAIIGRPRRSLTAFAV